MKNEYTVMGDVTRIYAKAGGCPVDFIIDTDDLEKVKSFKNTWHIKTDKNNDLMYVYGQTWEGRKATNIRLHRFLTDAPEDQVVDHLNGDGLDNRKQNIRIVSQLINGHNSKLSKNNTSGMNGVSWYKAYEKWRARVMVDRKENHLGYFDTKEEAMDAVRNFRKENNLYSRSVT